MKQKANIDRTEGHKVELNLEAYVFFLGPVSSVFPAANLAERRARREAHQAGSETSEKLPLYLNHCEIRGLNGRNYPSGAKQQERFKDGKTAAKLGVLTVMILSRSQRTSSCCSRHSSKNARVTPV